MFLPPLSYSLAPPYIYPNSRHEQRQSISNFHFLDVVRAISEAISIVSQGKHDPLQAHERMKTFYDWDQVTARTEVVYNTVMRSRQIELWERMQRWVDCLISHAFAVDDGFYPKQQHDGARPIRRTDLHHHPHRGLHFLLVP